MKELVYSSDENLQNNYNNVLKYLFKNIQFINSENTQNNN